MSPSVAVVGGGLAGLVAAVDLARSGLRPMLFERAEAPGGRARSRERDGFVFNQGPHALYNRGALRAALVEFGVAFSSAPADLGRAEAIWGGERRALPRDLGSVVRGRPLGWGERWQYARVFASLGSMDLEAWRGRPFSEFLTPLGPRARALLLAMARLSTYADAPDSLDAAATLAQLRMSGKGVAYVDGGWGRLVGGLEDVGRANGATIELGAPVAAVEPLGEGRHLLRREGAAPLEFDAVVLAAPPLAACAMAPHSQLLAQAVASQLPIRAASLDYALRRLPSPRATFALGIDAPLYFSVHSNVAALAPPGAALLHAAAYLAPGVEPSADVIGKIEALVERLQPGHEAQVVHRARLLGIPVAFDAPRWRAGGRMAPVALADAPGLFLAGDWVGEGAMLSDASAKSAREAAAAVRAHLRVK